MATSPGGFAGLDPTATRRVSCPTAVLIGCLGEIAGAIQASAGANSAGRRKILGPVQAERIACDLEQGPGQAEPTRRRIGAAG